MALFMKLTTIDKHEAIVNVDLITRMEMFSSAEPYTRITFDNGNTIAVKESAAHIVGGLDASRLPKMAGTTKHEEVSA